MEELAPKGSLDLTRTPRCNNQQSNIEVVETEKSNVDAEWVLSSESSTITIAPQYAGRSPDRITPIVKNTKGYSIPRWGAECVKFGTQIPNGKAIARNRL